jgi:xanthine dehydrogenase accessory factor
MIVESDGRIHGTIGGGYLEKTVIDSATQRGIKAEGSWIEEVDLTKKNNQKCGGRAKILFEAFGRRPQLHIFGAGHVGQALCQVHRESFFDLHLIDERAEWTEMPSLPKSVHRHTLHWQEYFDNSTFDEELSYVVIMTPNHEWDWEVLYEAAQKPLAYLGLMGSKHKWSDFKKSLSERGISKDRIEKIHCPIGLPIGGKSPFEIAISISAEMIQHYHKTMR